MDCDVCKEKLESLERRMNVKSEMIDEHETKIAVTNTKVDQLVSSLNSLTKALWGVACTTGATLLGFVLWFIQTK